MGGSASSERHNRRAASNVPPPQQQPMPQQQVQYQQHPPPPVARGPPQQQAMAPQYRAGPTLPPQQQQPPPAPPVQQAVSEARTIRNECAVIVETVKYDPQTTTLRFKTTCLVEADMEIHVAVRVDVMHKTAMITPNVAKEPPPRIHVGVNDGQEHEHFLDISRCREQELTYINEYPRQFPVVIVLFYKTQDGHHQAEFTMVQLRPTCKVVKQLIRTADEVYKVEHLFGGEELGAVVGEEHGSPAAGVESSPLEADDDGLCVICLTNDKNTVVMPCRHLCLCKDCAEELRQRTPKCPVCRGAIAQLVAVGGRSGHGAVSPQPAAA